MDALRRAELLQILKLAGQASPEREISFDQLQKAVYGLLAKSNTAMVSVQLEDVFARIEAQNLPGTINEHPNWQQKYPLSVEQFDTDDRLAAMGGIMRKNGRGASAPSTRIK